MYKIKVQTEVAGAHQLKLSYDSPCERLHGHNWLIEVELVTEQLDDNGMVCDFKVAKTILKKYVHDVIDHTFLNDIFDFNPTAENICGWVADQVTRGLIDNGVRGVSCQKVSVYETPNNVAIWEIG